MTVFRLLLWPFSLLYGGIMLLRNWLYDRGWLASKRFPVPVVSVGNLTVGGTGKTPHVEYLLRLLGGYNRAVLSRGYGRKSKGFVLADSTATATLLGDEPFQYHRDFPDVTVAVCERRPLGIERLLRIKAGLQVIILDDAMQHRPVSPSFNLMLTDYKRLFYKDMVLPAGLLREPRTGARRADAVVVTKCPAHLPLAEMEAIEQQVRKYARAETPVFFSSFKYGNPVPIGASAKAGKEVLLLTGIANAAPLIDFLKEEGYTIRQHINYPDHHGYTLQDLVKLRDLAKKEGDSTVSIITTSKDAAKLTDPALTEVTGTLPLFYIPIEVRFLHQGDDFDDLIRRHVASFRAK